MHFNIKKKLSDKIFGASVSHPFSNIGLFQEGTFFKNKIFH